MEPQNSFVHRRLKNWNFQKHFYTWQVKDHWLGQLVFYPFLASSVWLGLRQTWWWWWGGAGGGGSGGGMCACVCVYVCVICRYDLSSYTPRGFLQYGAQTQSRASTKEEICFPSQETFATRIIEHKRPWGWGSPCAWGVSSGREATSLLNVSATTSPHPPSWFPSSQYLGEFTF